jgi:hypothetical protein
MKLKLSFNLVKKSASESKNKQFYGILNIALYANSLKSPNSSTSGTFLRPSTPPHAILKLVNTACSRHICSIVLSAPRHENFEIWSTPLVTYTSIVPLPRAPRAGGLENAAIFCDLSTTNPKCDPTWDKGLDPTKETGWKSAPSMHRVLAPQKNQESVESRGWRAPKRPKNVINPKADQKKEKTWNPFKT